MIQVDTIANFWKFLIDRIKALSSSLKNYEQAKEDFFNPEAAAEAAANALKTGSKSAVTSRKVEQNPSKRTYKISEKIYSILKRFVIFATQNKKIAEYLLIQFNRKPEADLRSSKLKSTRQLAVKDKEAS